MEINKILERDFIRAIQKDANKRTKKEKIAIDKRNEHILSQFKWSKQIDEKLMLLNEKLREEEKKTFQTYRKIERQCKLMVEHGEIKDFNLELEWSCWNDNHYLNYDESVDGNPFFTNNGVGNFMIHQHNDEYLANCHNTISDMYIDLIPRNSPIITEPHCYMFHHLYDHCYDLTWFDIYNIDEVWTEIKVDYQFFSKIK